MSDSSNACDTHASAAMNDVWTWDFIHDRTIYLARIDNDDLLEAANAVPELLSKCFFSQLLKFVHVFADE